MLSRSPVVFATILLVATASPSPARADDDSEKSWFVSYVENKISTPDIKISLGQIDGALSSDVRISKITVADRRGVWLTVNDAHLVWSRAALARGKLSIDMLEASSIEILRKPDPRQSASGTGTGFEIPQLPVSVKLGRLEVPAVKVSAAIAGDDTVFSVAGSGFLSDGSLQTQLKIERTRPTGGRLAFLVDFNKATNILALDLSLQEPQGGFLSNLLRVPGKPSLGFAIAGTGPLDKFTSGISLSADTVQLLSGQAIIAGGAGGFRFTLGVDGSLERLVDPAYVDLVAGRSHLSMSASATQTGYKLDQFALKSGIFDMSMSGALAPDMFPTSLKLEARLGAEDRRPVLLPGGRTRVAAAMLSAGFGDGTWKTAFNLEQLSAGTLEMKRASIEAAGEAVSLADPLRRSLTFKVEGRGEGVSSADTALAQAVGDIFSFHSAGYWRAGDAVTFDSTRFESRPLKADFTGSMAAAVLNGAYTLSFPDLAAFSALAGRDLRGAARLEAKGDIALFRPDMALELAGTVTGLASGNRLADALMAGETRIKGGIKRDTSGLYINALKTGNRQFTAELSGLYGVYASDLSATASLDKAGILSPRMSGALQLMASLKGSTGQQALVFDLASDNLVLQAKPFKGMRAGFRGTLADNGVNGNLAVSGLLDKVPVRGAAMIDIDNTGVSRLSDLSFEAGNAKITGQLSLYADSLMNGKLRADIPDMSTIAPLLLSRGGGSISFDMALNNDNGTQNAAAKGKAKSFRLENVSIGTASFDISATDLRGTPGLNGQAAASALRIGGFSINQIQANVASERNASTSLRIQATIPKGKVSLKGTFQPVKNGFDARLETFDAQHNGISASLQGPVTVTHRSGTLNISRAVLRAGKGGTLSVEGSAGQTLAMSLRLNELPAALANIVTPYPGISGTVSGEARLTGTPADPVAQFQAKVSNLAAAPLRMPGLSALQASATGRYSAGVLKLDASVNGSGGIAMKINAHVPVSGGGLDASARGTVPLTIINGMLSERGARATGTLAIDARASGSLAAPAFSGQAVISGGTLNDPVSNLKLTSLGGTVRFDGNRASVPGITGITPGNGKVSLTGTVSLRPDFAADMTLALRNARLSDGRIATAILNADVTLRGPLLSQPVLGGRIGIDRAEITIPERFSANAALLGVKHLKAPPELTKSLARIDRLDGSGTGGKRKHSPNLQLDLALEAPARIFVRGRGIDAELGGRLELRGPASRLAPVGSFNLRRGSLDIIGRHIVLESGNVSLTGDLDPTIDFVASSRTNSVAVMVRVTGRASAPQVVLSSVPELPPDEVMAHFLFGRSIHELSPFQVVQLATAAAQLADGASGPGLLDSIRKSTGLDNLNIVADREGNAAVQAGRYLSDKVYLGVTSGVGGNTDATINIDITRHLKLRGQVGTDGSSGGIVYEREY